MSDADALEGSKNHVLLLSVDGLHESDLLWWVHTHPHSHLATLSRRSTRYTNAATPVPSDSFPGLIAQVTGGDPRTTGVYYDVSYNRRLLPPGSSCDPRHNHGGGSSVIYDESLDRDSSSLDAGFGIPNLYPRLPSSILALPRRVPTIEQRMLDPGNLPLEPSSCKPEWARSYLKVNTVFEVAKHAGLRTAWSDKHPSYEILAGRKGHAISDLFTPEIDSSITDPNQAGGPGPAWTDVNAKTQYYDGIKVRAILNEIDGFDHSGKHHVGVPAIFGMNFQSVSTAQKLAVSPFHGSDEPGGYVHRYGRWVPGPILRDALGFVDKQVGRTIRGLTRRGLLGSTTVILSARHGQSPRQTSDLRRIDDGRVMDALNAAWRAHGGSEDLVAFSINDDAMYIWLNDRSLNAIRFARRFLMNYDQSPSARAATNYAGDWVGFTSSGLSHLRSGPHFFDVSRSDPRVPDFVGDVQHGVVYTDGTSKIAEHGGSARQDRHVPILVYGGGAPGQVAQSVETTQIAPTIMHALGFDTQSLRAVRLQGTRALPEP